MKSIKDMADEDKPRERLLKYGAARLKDEELVMILLGSGIAGCGVRPLAKKIIELVDERGIDNLQAEDLKKIRGIQDAKACIIAAAFEITRRRVRERGVKIKLPSDVYPLIRHYGDRNQEHFLCVSLNGANEVMEIRVITIGLLNRTQVHPREVFADALQERAASVIVAHNHPSGNLTPSREDIAVTKRLRESGDLLGITLLDHLIFSASGYYSIAESGEW